MPLKMVNGEVVETDLPQVKVRFYEHTKRVGPKEFKSVDMISVRSPGVKDYISRPVTDDDKANYPREWEDYQRGIEAVDDGCTPLRNLKRFKDAFGLELDQMGIHTVEELALRPEPPEVYLEELWREAKVRVRVEAEMRGETHESQLTG